MLLGSIEAGGTKFVCAIGDENYRIQDQMTIPTTTPSETLEKVIAYFKNFPIEAMGIGSFGPIEMRQHAKNYGFITSTPKKAWENTDLLGIIQKEITVPTFFTTDVNSSAYGEYVMSTLANEKIDSLIYYTVGTGIGGGAVIDGKFLGELGLGHPEMGHTFVKRHPGDTQFSGVCPYHKDCLEGLASGPSIEKRLGVKGETISPDHEVFDFLAYYIAQGVIQGTLLIRPDKIVLGGSVVTDSLLGKIRCEVKKQLNNYLFLPPLEKYITRPLIKNNGSATLGNFALGLKELEK